MPTKIDALQLHRKRWIAQLVSSNFVTSYFVLQLDLDCAQLDYSSTQVPLQDPCHVFSVALMTAAATAATTPPPPPPSLSSSSSSTSSPPDALQALTAAAFTTVCNWQHALTSTCVAQNKRLEAEAHEREERELLFKQRKEFENKKFSQQLVWSQELSAQVELTVAAETQLTDIKAEMEQVKREAQLNQEQQEKALESFLNQHKAHMQQVEATHARAIQDTLASYASDKHDWEQTRDKMLSEADVVANRYAEEARQLSHTIAMLEVSFLCSYLSSLAARLSSVFFPSTFNNIYTYVSLFACVCV
jgi:hypothetical protein